ncbi:MAG: efflux RND transporter periplasmic adaptor subunit [Rhodospirillales bacterium]
MLFAAAAGLLFLAPPVLAGGWDQPPVGVDEVRRAPVKQTIPVIGRLIAPRTSVVAARIGGPMAEMLMKVGERVEKGQVIAVLVLDSLHWKRQLQKADTAEKEAALKTAKAKLALKKQELKRLARLRKSAAFSEARHDDKRIEVTMAESTVAEARSALQSARANLKLAEINLYNAQIRAPYGGVVSKRHTEAGAYVRVGEAVVTLIDDKNLEIEANVPTERLAALGPGISVTFELAGKAPLSATVRAMVPEENPLTRTRTVRFTPRFDGVSDNLAANQSVTLRLPLGQARDAVTVHKDAVLNRMGRTIVFVVNGNAAEVRPVKLGEAVGGRFEVLDGLKPGDLVVVRGNERLLSGQKVKIKGAS